jgi:hypothetical protein
MVIDETDNEFLYEKYYKPLYAPIGDKNFIPNIKKGPQKFNGVLILDHKIIEDYDFQGNTVIELKYCEIFDISSKNGILQVYKNSPKLVNTSMMRIKLNDYKRGKRSFLINKIINESNIK